MALIERSGKFRMMSVAELTALQRHSSPNSSPETVSRTPRPPSTPSAHSPRFPVFYQLFSLNNINRESQGDNLSGKPGNVREFDSCRGNVRDFTKSQGKKSCQGKVA